MRPILSISLALLMSFATACSDDHDHDHEGESESVEAEACEHMADGPATAVAATAVAGDEAPALSLPHERNDVALVANASGDFEGWANLEVGEAGTYVFFANNAVSIAIDGEPAVTPEAVEACAEVSQAWRFALDVGTHRVKFGPGTEASVRVVVEREAP